MLTSIDADIQRAQDVQRGLSFGDDTLAAYKIGTWTPTITAGATNPTISYGSQDGAYIRIGGVVFYDAVITITAITVAGAGEWRFSLPLAVGRTMQGVAQLIGVDVPDDYGQPVFPRRVGRQLRRDSPRAR